MAFKLRSNNTGSIPLHNGGGGGFKKSPFSNIKTPLFAIDPTKKEKEKEKTASEFEEIGRSVTTREGEQNGVRGTFTDTNITERMDFDDFIPAATQGPQATNVPKYLETLKNKYPGVPGSVLVEQGFIGPEFEDQFPLDYDQRNRLETSFDPDPEVPQENPYTAYDTSFNTAMDFGRRGTSRMVKNEEEALKVIQRARSGRKLAEKYSGKGERGLNASQTAGVNGSARLIDADRNNYQAETARVRGITNEEDYAAGKDYGRAYVTEMINAERDALRQRYKGQENRVEYNKEVQALKEKGKDYFSLVNSGQFATPDMQKRFESSYDDIYNQEQPEIDPAELEGLNRAQIYNAKRKFRGGGRTGIVKPTSNVTVDTRFLDR
jgi:hypothetical protein